MKRTLLPCLAGIILWNFALAQVSFQDIPNLPFFDSQGYLTGIAWVDVNNDNILDVSVSGTTGAFPNFVNATAIYLGDGAGNFANTGLLSSAQNNPFGQGWADYDNDGDLDVYIAATWNNAGINELWRNDGAAGFSQITNSGATPNVAQPYEGTVSWGDYDNDGFADLLLARWNNLPNRLFRNNGNGTFSEITSGDLVGDLAWTSGCYWADYDNDGDIDVYVVNYQIGAAAPGANDLFRNNGDGTFTKIGPAAGGVVLDAQNSRSANWVDINNDGWLDLFVGNQFGQDKIYFNNADGSFTTQNIGNPTYTTWSSNWGDIDNDGDLDLFTMGFWGFESRVWRNDGAGAFTDITDLFPNVYPLQTSGSSSNAVILVDYDRDGWLDLHIAQPDVVDDRLYRNLGDGCKSWLEVKCTGVQSNRAAIGATLRAKATVNGASVWQMRHVSAQTAATGQNPLWQHFGFGDATIIDSLIVEWPSGANCVLTKVVVNQFVEIFENCSLQTILSKPIGYAGENALVDWCEGQGPIDLFPYLGGNPETGGQWTDANFQPVSMPVQPVDIFSEWYYLIEGPCADTAKVSVILNPMPDVSIFPGDTTLEIGATLGMLASGATSYSWFPANQLNCVDCANPIFTAAESAQITVVGEDVYGCRDTATISIIVVEKITRFELPNAFTPDGDGVNDRFRPLFSGTVFKSFHIRIFNRWGELVFETRDPLTGWDGANDGNTLPSDAYGFVMVYTLTNGTQGVEKGEVTLVR